ncbi:MAG: cytochrome b [Xanthobacteraceae bacterium]|nr:MAG: cytochrome b [Xanthobacteraceae bacterium]
MRILDTSKGYGLISIALHWIVAAFITFLFVSGQVMGFLENTPAARDVRTVHIAVGALAASFIIARLIWRTVQGTPEKIGGDTALNKLALAIQWLLLAAMIGSVLTGMFSVWSNGRDIAAFSLFTLPTPMGKNEALHHLLEDVHEVLANTIAAMVVLHVAGAVKHLVVDRDGVMRRMLRPVGEG